LRFSENIFIQNYNFCSTLTEKSQYILQGSPTYRNWRILWNCWTVSSRIQSRLISNVMQSTEWFQDPSKVCWYINQVILGTVSPINMSPKKKCLRIMEVERKTKR